MRAQTIEVGEGGARGHRTRQAIQLAALELLEGGKGFGALSLREVTREVGIVPTAFYRHFQDMDELGLSLVDEAMRTLRQMIRSARADELPPENIIRASVGVLVRHVHGNRLHFRFIAREMHGGSGAIREAIRAELRLFASELATDLARLPYLNRWSTDDLQMMAALFVNAMVSIAEQILDAPPQRPQAEQEIVQRAEKQLRLIALGARHWRSEPAPRGA